jgi:ribosome-associated toxin RatA of RatAB toxin-antitoxin module
MARYAASYDFAQDPDRIYGILSDVERMSEFIPLCKRSEVLSRQTTADTEEILADFMLRYRQVGFELAFDLALTLNPAERRIFAASTETSFGSGSASWTVTGVGRAGSQVLFESDYKVRSPLIRVFFGRRLLLQGMDRIMARVRQRAEARAGW